MAEITYRQALHDALREELLRDEHVFLLGEEIGVFEGSYKITAGLLTEFGPRRVVDTPIVENGFVGMAVGAAMLGLRPIVEIMTINFIVLAMDQIVNQAAKIYAMFGGQCPVPLVIRTHRTWRCGSRTFLASRSWLRPRLPMRRGCCAPPCVTTTRSSFSKTWPSIM